jgi:hypothetical protein
LMLLCAMKELPTHSRGDSKEENHQGPSFAYRPISATGAIAL